MHSGETLGYIGVDHIMAASVYGKKLTKFTHIYCEISFFDSVSISTMVILIFGYTIMIQEAEDKLCHRNCSVCMIIWHRIIWMLYYQNQPNSISSNNCEMSFSFILPDCILAVLKMYCMVFNTADFGEVKTAGIYSRKKCSWWLICLSLTDDSSAYHSLW